MKKRTLALCLPVVAIILLSVQVRAQTKLESFTSSNGYHSYYAVFRNDTSAVDYWTYLNKDPNSGIFVVNTLNGNYNCHAFAWTNDSTVWVDGSHDTTKAPQIYYNTVSNYYYTKTTDPSDAEIAVYGSDVNNSPTHSAVRLTNSTNPYVRQFLNNYPQYAGWYISKWDGGPLVIHNLDSCPFYGNVAPTLYKKRSESAGSNHLRGANYLIKGTQDAFCSSGTQFELGFSYAGSHLDTVLIPTLKTFTVTWSCSSHITLSPGATAYPVTASSSINGPGEWIKATINFTDGTSDTVTRLFAWSGGPAAITSISTSQWTAGGPGYLAINVSQSGTEFYGWPFDGSNVVPPTVPDDHGASSYTWTCSGLGYTQNPSTINYRYTAGSFSGTGAAVLTIHAANGCGTTSDYQAVNVTSGGFRAALSPNPATDQVTVNILDNNPGGVQGLAGTPVTYTVQVTDVIGTVWYTAKRTGSSFTIPVDKLKAGNYVVEVSDGKTISSKSLLVTH
jgi:hypothetical protein